MAKTPNQLFEDYVFHSLLYYGCDEPQISDYEFDQICRELQLVWPQVTHPDKGLSDPSALSAGTGFQMQGNWPKWAKDRALANGIDHWCLKAADWTSDDPGESIILTQLAKVLQFYTGVGSRETPTDVLCLMRRLGKVNCDQGYRGRSGCAPGADTAFWEGAQLSERYSEVGFDNFLPNAWMFNREEFGFILPDARKRIFDATSFVNTYQQAQEIAYKARGSFEGLGKGGIQLHTRNAYQVLGPSLDEPSRAVIFWAQPVGRQGKVRGGTNTAVQIAIENGIETINLYKDLDRNRIETFLADIEYKHPNAHIA